MNNTKNVVPAANMYQYIFGKFHLERHCRSDSSKPEGQSYTPSHQSSESMQALNSGHQVGHIHGCVAVVGDIEPISNVDPFTSLTKHLIKSTTLIFPI